MPGLNSCIDIIVIIHVAFVVRYLLISYGFNDLLMTMLFVYYNGHHVSVC